MNRIDRSSDNWYHGMDSEELSCEPDIYFDEPEAEGLHRVKKYTDADVHEMLFKILHLRIDEIKILRVRLFFNDYSLDEIAKEVNDTKKSVLMKIRALVRRMPEMHSLFKHLKMEQGL